MTTLTPRRASEPADQADRRTLAATAVGGVALDIGIRSGVVSLGGAIAAALVAAALLAGSRPRTTVGRACVANVAVFGSFLAVRSSSWLVAVDVIVISGSVVAAVLLGREASFGDVGPRRLAGRAVGAVRPALTGLTFVARPLRRLSDPDQHHTGRRARLGGVLRGALLAVPVLAVLGSLLASADAVFARFTRVDHLLPGDVWAHVVLLVVGTAITAGLLHAAVTPPAPDLPAAPQMIGAQEWTVVLGAVVALFLAFAAAQAVAVSQGGRRVLATEGLTYATYARSGYFQLLAVAALTAALLLGLGAVAQRPTPASDRRFRILGGVAVALTLVVLAVAVRRLGLYEDAYGWTMLRLLVKASAVWMAVAFVLLGLRIGGLAPERQWLLPAVTATAVVVALTLNLADPEAAVVRHNVARGLSGHEVDPAYLADLSDDAVPALAAALPTLAPTTRGVVSAAICAGGGAGSGLSWNRSAQRAADAREQVCP